MIIPPLPLPLPLPTVPSVLAYPVTHRPPQLPRHCPPALQTAMHFSGLTKPWHPRRQFSAGTVVPRAFVHRASRNASRARFADDAFTAQLATSSPRSGSLVIVRLVGSKMSVALASGGGVQSTGSRSATVRLELAILINNK